VLDLTPFKCASWPMAASGRPLTRPSHDGASDPRPAAGLPAGGGFGLGLAFFFLLVAVLVPLGVGPEGGTLGRIAPGILWVGALLACLLSLDRIFALDHEDGSLDLLATAPIPLEASSR
jgi:heme exporter protein CcmB